ncbi:type II toxin-antitoxin system HipA family toxin [Leifsonia shinshuensis]|uniref:Serine/threonine-protein kinase HipA n=1 Tax=Leifsonia shinshuensis TaxID=150026 RepID=A0A853CUH7_9MICO|nr:type II toxin-antitoxin system HipA family toxin [Leifsonia shinshuensis]NYJ22854.1 serine/threonine-protein kinase HipA [Leifsonia shinshuensis]
MTDIVSAAEVYLDENGAGPTRVGLLRPSFMGGRTLAASSFEYDPAYLGKIGAYELSPDLPLTPGRTYTPENTVLFGAFADAAPDEWGQKIVQANHALRLKEDPSLPRRVGDFDYLLGVSDFSRMGALRFKAENSRHWLSEDTGVANIHELGKILRVARRYEDHEATDEDVEYLAGIATSPGGARPKANVLLPDGSLALAKLPHSKDADVDTEAWEAVALTIARRIGTPTPEFTVQPAGEGRSVLIVKRFDRDGETVRRGYMSAATALRIGKHDTGSRLTYEEFADVLAATSANPEADLHDMFRRIALTVFINNVDDHWGNHGFLRQANGWRLAPIFDINPHRHGGIIASRPISDNDDPRDRDIRNLIDIADTFNLTRFEAIDIAMRISGHVALWPQIADLHGIPKAQQQAMASAFDDTQRQRIEELAATIDPDWLPRANLRAAPHRDGMEWVPPSLREGKPVTGYWRKARKR